MSFDPQEFESLERYVAAVSDDFERRGDYASLAGYVTSIVLPTLSELVASLVVDRHRVDDSHDLPVIHYTSIANMFSIIEEGGLHLFDSENSNDPSEGTYFARHLNVADVPPWAREANPSHAYVASFVLPNPEESRHDDLVYWRTYGQEGEGCSMELLVPKASLRTVLYGASEVQQTVAALLPILKALDPLAQLDTRIANHLSGSLWNALTPLRYLYKDGAYEYENECRYVISSGEVEPSEISFRYGGSARHPGRVRHYCHHDELAVSKILTSGSSITFGPTVAETENLKHSTSILLQKHGLTGAQVNESKISYRRP